MIKHISHESIQKWLGKSETDNMPSKSQAFQIFTGGRKSKYQLKDQLLVTPSREQCEEQNYYQLNYNGKRILYGNKYKKDDLKTIHRAEENLQTGDLNSLTPYVSPCFQLTSSIHADKISPQSIECKKNCCMYIQQKYSQEIKYLTINNQQLYEQVQLLSSQIRHLEDNMTNLNVENDNLSNKNQKLKAKIKNIVKSFNQIRQKCLEMEKQCLKDKQSQIADQFKDIQIIEKIALSYRKQKQIANKQMQSNSKNKRKRKRSRTQYYDKNNKEDQQILPLLTWQDMSQNKITPNKNHQIPTILAKTKFSSTDMTTKESLKFDRHKNLSRYSPNILEKQINKYIGKLSKQKNIILMEIGQNQKTQKLKPQIPEKHIIRKYSNIKENKNKDKNHEKYTSFFAVTSISSNKNKNKNK